MAPILMTLDDPQTNYQIFIARRYASGVVGPYMRPIAIWAMVKQPGGQHTGFALLF